MEGKKSIQELLDSLKTLRIEEANLSAQLEEAIRERGVAGTASLKRQEERGSIKQGFSKGDRIWITNKLNKPASWDNSVEWFEKEGKTATVTGIVIKGQVTRVHFLTDNGVHTWRAPNNIRLIQHHIQQDE
jgi:hypothetical protein